MASDAIFGRDGELAAISRFFEDDRDVVELPEFTQAPCMEGCKEGVPEITRHATVLDVTPETPDDGSDAPPPMD